MKTFFPGQMCVEKGANSLRFNREHLLHAGGCDEWDPTLPLSYSISLAPARFMQLHLRSCEAETEKLPLGLALGSPNFPSGCEGKLGVALESLQGLRDLT